MVGAAGGAGGQTASMKISGSLDTTNIERGFSRVKGGFQEVKGRAKGFTADLTRMKSAASGVATGLAGLAAAGVGTLTALAKNAPATAGAMAKIKVGMQKLSFAAGKALAPAFEKVGGWLNTFADWADAHPKIFAGMVGTLGTLAALKFTGVLKLLGTLGSTVVGGSVLTALGYLAGIAAAGIGGAKLGEYLTGKGKEYVGMGDKDYMGDQSAQTMFKRLPKKVWSDISDYTAPWEREQGIEGEGGMTIRTPAFDRRVEEIKEEGYSPTPDGAIHADTERDRKFFLLEWWDSVWS